MKQVKDIVTKGAKPADPMPAGMKEEEESSEGEVVAEAETTEEETEEVIAEEEIDIEADVNALLEGEELSEEFQNKARTIFEAAIKSKLADVKESVKAQYEEQLVEEVAAIKSELEERVDAYLEYVLSLIHI